jgi:hypothetical protein
VVCRPSVNTEENLHRLCCSLLVLLLHQVHFFISPQTRCMRTAHPLISRVAAAAEAAGGTTAITAAVLPDLIEAPGLMVKADQESFFAKYESLQAEGKSDEAAAFRAGFTWTPCGEDVSVLQGAFPWARFAPELFPG